MDLVEERFEVEPLLHRAVETVAPRADEKGLRLVWEVEADVPRWLLGDAGRIRQVLLNLLGNAVKFTEVGQITASVSLNHADAESAELTFAVQDTGIGIPKDRQHAVFEAFTQADPSVTRFFGGTGLGLSISAQLVRLMGGELRVESEPGQGSTFEFTIRCRRAPAASDKSQHADVRLVKHLVQRSGRPLCVLLAEDNPQNGYALVALLERRGHTVTHVEDGILAVAAVEADPSRFDLVLMDINMPGMGGIDATRAIRRVGEAHGVRVPILALTADALPANRLRCREAGMDAFLTKPVDIDELCSLMERFADEKMHAVR